MTTTELIDMSLILPGDNGSGHQDRTRFDPVELAKLADNIGAHGLIQPITVRPLDDTDLFRIVAGERRFRACELLGWQEIPAHVADLTDDEAAAIMLAENLGREDLDPVDEARAYAARIDCLGWTISQVAEAAGVSEIRVQFRVKLLKLRPDLLDLVRSGNLSLGYAQILADGGLDPDRQLIAFRRLRDNPKPAMAWFRRQVAELFEEQAQGHLFELPILGGPLEEASARQFITLPPTPATATPEVPAGVKGRQAIEHQASFWSQAAEAWDRLGKPFKRQECEAAAQALQYALAIA